MDLEKYLKKAAYLREIGQSALAQDIEDLVEYVVQIRKTVDIVDNNLRTIEEMVRDYYRE